MHSSRVLRALRTPFFGFVAALSLVLATTASAQEPADTAGAAQYEDVSLEELVNYKVDDVEKFADLQGSLFEKAFKFSSAGSKKGEKPWESPVSISVVYDKEIETFGALSLGEVLDRVTSLYLMGTYILAQNTVVVRGDNTNVFNQRVLVLLNGRPIRESAQGGDNRSIYTMFPLERIERLEIIRGPGSVLYGAGAYIGVINIVTKSAEDQQYVANVRYGSFERMQASVAGGERFGDFEISGGFNILDDGGWDFTAYDEPIVIPNPLTGGTLYEDPSNKETIKRKMNGYGANLAMRYADFSFDAFYGMNEHRNVGLSAQWGNPIEFVPRADNIVADLGFRRALLPEWELALNVTYNYYGFRFYEPVDSIKEDRIDGANSDWLFEATNFFHFDDKLSALVGGVVTVRNTEATLYDRFEIDSLGYGISYPDYYLGNNPNPYAIDLNETVWSVYGQAEYSPIEQLDLVAGGQLNKRKNLDADFVPRVSALFRFADNFNIRASHGGAFREPSLAERYMWIPGVEFGQPDLKAEKISTSEAQLNYISFENRLILSLTGFYSEQSDIVERSNEEYANALFLIVQTPMGAMPIYLPTAYTVNAGGSTSQGVEFEAQAVPVKGFSLRSGISYQTFDYKDDNDVNGTPQLMVKLGAAYENPVGYSIGVFNSYFGDLEEVEYLSEPNPAAEAYSFLSANVNLSITKLLLGRHEGPNVVLGLYGTNLLDEEIHYPEVIQQIINSWPGRPGRAFYANLKLEL
jgi:outer membrane receptor for ferrienterochelin and colicins